MIEEGSNNSYLKYIRDLHVEGGVVTGIFVWADHKANENNITVHQYDILSSHKITDYHRTFSLLSSPPTIIDVTDDQVTMLIQENVYYGINCVVVQMFEDQESQIVPLTKTKNISISSRYFEFGDDRGLVFFDMVDNNKIIYFASSNQELVEKTTKIMTINPVRVFGMLLMVLGLAALLNLFSYVLEVAVLPFLLLILMNKFMPNFKNKELIKGLISAIFHTVLKVFLVYQYIHVSGTFILRPPLVGSEPYIYIFMALTSVFSYYLMVRRYQWNRQYETTITMSYLHFLLYEYVIFTLLVFVYIVTFMVIGKV